MNQIQNIDLGNKFGLVQEQNAITIFLQGYASFKTFKDEFPVIGLKQAFLYSVQLNSSSHYKARHLDNSYVIINQGTQIHVSSISGSTTLLNCVANMEQAVNTFEITAVSPNCEAKREGGEMHKTACYMKKNFELKNYRRGIEAQIKKDFKVMIFILMLVLFGALTIIAILGALFWRTKKKLLEYTSLDQTNISSIQENKADREKEDKENIEAFPLPSTDRFSMGFKSPEQSPPVDLEKRVNVDDHTLEEEKQE